MKFTLAVVTLLWKYTGLFLVAGVPLAFVLLYRFSAFSALIAHRVYVGYACLAALVPLFLLFRWYKYFIRGGNRRCSSSRTLNGKTVIITGGNSGIGKGAAIDLARRGARVIIACRNAQRAQEAITDIKARSGSQEVFFRKLDLASFKSVREFADGINEEEKRLDVLINNAGIPDTNTHENRKPLPTEDGLSQSFQINHFGHFLLTHLLLDLLKKSAPSRVVNVSSRLNTAPRSLDFSVGEGKVRYPKLTLYTRGKLANVLFTSEFSERMRGTGVTSYAVDPGIIYSNIWDKQITSWKMKLLSPVFWVLFCDEESGANTTVYCAAEEGLESGKVYFDCRKTRHVNPLVKDAEIKRKLWEVSMEATGLKDRPESNHH